MTADYVIGELSRLQYTLRQLNDPDILSVEVNSDGDARIHIYAPTMDDAEEVIGDMGSGLYHIDVSKSCLRCSVMDTNGVEVFWIAHDLEIVRKGSAAPDAPTSEAAEEKNDCCGPSRASIIGESGPEVKEAEGK